MPKPLSHEARTFLELLLASAGGVSNNELGWSPDRMDAAASEIREWGIEVNCVWETVQ
jgi:hypothetical protein